MKSLPSLFCIVAMKREPRAGIRKSPFVKSGLEDGHGYELKPPYLPGEKCYRPEPIYYNLEHNNFYYLSDRKGCGDAIYRVLIKIIKSKLKSSKTIYEFSPLVMPEIAARRFAIVKSCEPIEIAKVTEEDAIKLGFGHQEPYDVETYERTDSYEIAQFVAWWDQKHPGKTWGWRIEADEVKEM